MVYQCQYVDQRMNHFLLGTVSTADAWLAGSETRVAAAVGETTSVALGAE